GGSHPPAPQHDQQQADGDASDHQFTPGLFRLRTLGGLRVDDRAYPCRFRPGTARGARRAGLGLRALGRGARARLLGRLLRGFLGRLLRRRGGGLLGGRLRLGRRVALPLIRRQPQDRHQRGEHRDDEQRVPGYAQLVEAALVLLLGWFALRLADRHQLFAALRRLLTCGFVGRAFLGPRRLLCVTTANRHG